MRFRSLVISLGLIAAACGGGVAETTVAPEPGGTSASSSVTAAPDSTETPEVPANTAETKQTEAPRTDGIPAPDFTTVLADGSDFKLGEHDKPVYLVFWAEW